MRTAVNGFSLDNYRVRQKRETGLAVATAGPAYKPAISNGYPDEGFIVDANLQLYVPLWLHDVPTAGTFKSVDQLGSTCTMTGALWGPQGRTFDGTDDNVNCGTTHAITGNSARTIEAWIYPTEAKVCGIAGWGANATQQLSFLEEIVSGAQFYVYWLGYSADFAGLGRYNINAWYHVVVTYNTNQACVLYVNAAVDATGTAGNVLNTPSSNLLIGVDGVSPARYFKGVIGEVRVYNRVLTSAEVTHNYNATRWRYL